MTEVLNDSQSNGKCECRYSFLFFLTLSSCSILIFVCLFITSQPTSCLTASVCVLKECGLPSGRVLFFYFLDSQQNPGETHWHFLAGLRPTYECFSEAGVSFPTSVTRTLPVHLIKVTPQTCVCLSVCVGGWLLIRVPESN